MFGIVIKACKEEKVGQFHGSSGEIWNQKFDLPIAILSEVPIFLSFNSTSSLESTIFLIASLLNSRAPNFPAKIRKCCKLQYVVIFLVRLG